jgi:hypothetical protein
MPTRKHQLLSPSQPLRAHPSLSGICKREYKLHGIVPGYIGILFRTLRTMRYSLSPSYHTLPHRVPDILLLMHNILHHVLLQRLPQLALRLLILLVRYTLQLQQPARILVRLGHEITEAIKLLMSRIFRVFGRLGWVLRVEAI